MRNSIVARRYVDAYTQSFSESESDLPLDLLITLSDIIVLDKDSIP